MKYWLAALAALLVGLALGDSTTSTTPFLPLSIPSTPTNNQSLCYSTTLNAWTNGNCGGGGSGISNPITTGVTVGSGGSITTSGTGTNVATNVVQYNPLYYGAKCDGTTDDTAAFNALALSISNSNTGNGDIALPPNQKCLINSGNLTLQPGVGLKGTGQPFIGGLVGGEITTGGIVLNPAYSITCGPQSRIRDLHIVRSGLANQPANMEAQYTYVTSTIADNSIAISNTNYDCTIEHVQIIGFNKGVFSNHGARLIIHELYCDTANCLEVEHNADNSYIGIVRGYPFWDFNLNGRITTYSATIVAGGSGFSNGDVLTVTGGTCSTQPTYAATVSGSAVLTLAVNDSGDCTVNPQTYGLNATCHGTTVQNLPSRSDIFPRAFQQEPQLLRMRVRLEPHRCTRHLPAESLAHELGFLFPWKSRQL